MAKRPETDDRLSRADRLAADLIKGLPVTHRWIHAAGVTTSVLEGGDGPAVLLLHGQAAFAESWGLVIDRLVGGFRVIAPDLPGLGRSLVRTGELDGPRVMAWLEDLIGQTCAERPALVGVSLGGTVSAHFALEHEDLLRGIVLIASGSLGPFRPAPGALLALVRYMRRPTVEGNQRFFRYVVKNPDRARAAMGARMDAFGAYHVDRISQPSVRAANRRLVRWSAKRIPVGDLRRIQVPVALVWGRDDRIMRFRTAHKLSRRLGWPLYPIEDAGHLIFADQPEAFLSALDAALQTLG